MCAGFFLFYYSFPLLEFLYFLPRIALGRFRTDRTLRKFTKVNCTNRGSNSVQNPNWNDPSVMVESVLTQIFPAVLYLLNSARMELFIFLLTGP